VAVIDVAGSDLKERHEPRLIGAAVVFNIRRLLAEYEHWFLQGKRALLVGCGAIGSEIGKALIAEECQLTVVEDKTREAIGAQFPTGATYHHSTELAGVIGGHDLVVGCTGRGVGYPTPESRPPFDHESHFRALKNGAVLVNASSKMCEFNQETLSNVAPQYETKRAFGRERRMSDGKLIRVAANGFPINFYNSESAPAERMQPILAMLFVGACRLAQDRPAPGVHDFPPSDQDHILDVYRAGAGEQ
jgi:S-adenosylhomocysteine hydrolase